KPHSRASYCTTVLIFLGMVKLPLALLVVSHACNSKGQWLGCDLAIESFLAVIVDKISCIRR
ncbi:hypothetical protein, partial [Vibrio parahaemolyticus]|uniref:hypothetical protein n=1 Tax=Vibrio parahaemolyticus TaxID=670 RepID=UPI001E52BE2D